jgi:hypothetical protein
MHDDRSLKEYSGAHINARRQAYLVVIIWIVKRSDSLTEYSKANITHSDRTI